MIHCSHVHVIASAHCTSRSSLLAAKQALAYEKGRTALPRLLPLIKADSQWLNSDQYALSFADDPHCVSLWIHLNGGLTWPWLLSGSWRAGSP